MAVEDIYGSIGTPITSNVKLALSADAASVTDILNVVSRDSTTVFSVDRNKNTLATGLIARDITDPTKRVQFGLTGLTTGNTRTLTVQDGNYTLAGTDRVNTFSANQSFNNNTFFLNGSVSGSLGIKAAASIPSGTVSVASGTYTLVGETVTQTLTNKEYSGGTISGSFTNTSSQNVNQIPVTNQTIIGPSFSAISAGETVTIMDLVYLSSDGTWRLTDADGDSTSTGLLGVSLESKTAGQLMTVATKGAYIRNDSWNWGAGKTLYVSDTPATFTITQPSGTNDVIRVAGFAISNDEVYFDPSPDYLTHV
jgi:hypothetical protein